MREENLERYSNYQQVTLSHPYYLSLVPLTEALERVVKKYAKGRLLDIGCGNKPYEGMFHSLINEYVGCDIVQSSESKVNIICDALQIPMPDSSFDTIISTQVIEHVDNHQALVNEAYRLLKPGGHFIVSGPMYWPLHEEPHDYFRFTKHGFRYILEKANFSATEILSNGGKWALMGQVIILNAHPRIVKLKSFRYAINRVFSYLDKKYYNDFNTMNYVVVGKKGIDA